MTKLKPGIDPVASATYTCGKAAKSPQSGWGYRGWRVSCGARSKRQKLNMSSRQEALWEPFYETQTYRTVGGSGFWRMA